jgi:hypothetical protein
VWVVSAQVDFVPVVVVTAQVMLVANPLCKTENVDVFDPVAK